jgi:hypothetical protein
VNSSILIDWTSASRAILLLRSDAHKALVRALAQG